MPTRTTDTASLNFAIARQVRVQATDSASCKDAASFPFSTDNASWTAIHLC